MFLVIIITTLLSFFLPPQSGEKIILNGCTAVIITLYLLYFTQKIPPMGSHTPLVGKNNLTHVKGSSVEIWAASQCTFTAAVCTWFAQQLPSLCWWFGCLGHNIPDRCHGWSRNLWLVGWGNGWDLEITRDRYAMILIRVIGRFSLQDDICNKNNLKSF